MHHPSPAEPDPQEQARLFREGVARFNAGEWFEAHEVWEALWHTLDDGERKQFVQGLIQCAVALEHARRGNPRGALTMFDRARPRFEGLPQRYMGVDIAALLASLAKLLAPLRDLPADALRPRAGRGLELPINLCDAPTIELQNAPVFGESR
ncbi:MAG: DUF309 domain-containing protein [Phycisphaeraceae bacterium]